jgi:pyridinium-3,5-biscarboxylic acid mononucleotide synthase
VTMARNDALFGDLRDVLAASRDQPNGNADDRTLRADPNRQLRTGIPEVVYAASKPAQIVAEALRQLATANGRAMASRVSEEAIPELRDALEPALTVEYFPIARGLVAFLPEAPRPATGGVVGILSAGTSDLPVAAEAALMATEMGAHVLEAWDVGVAGIHRVFGPLQHFIDQGADVIVVAAGMDGALPSVVAGLVDVPVIGLPTSVGYGLGAGGVGALTSMLQSCAPGLTVVNIDNGIGAGSTAALIANRMARARASARD